MHLRVNWSKVSEHMLGLFIVKKGYKKLVISMDSVFLLIDIFVIGIILLLLSKEGFILKKIIKFFQILGRRIDILSAEVQLIFILEHS